ncbi:MAG: YhcN/YlaJ family sporulation lipoprotein [Bacillota bacterium]|uniref:YhcN/YlaJ family sporulation lipoprotein n=1 Tax=Virgibacillus salarius TaxID=447199 RepID=A0A941I8K3_9BACI|nr:MULTISPECIES: YhcN/YlaJ family sporulation lipoprotein [Bacillaceae]NAZ07245.1 hypothetical protein [Agaribacter marinus]MBR7794523.1 YhcN/YlaJ family sporulation lipoprotein [Virgibacillus salarius]MCC2249488.1 YhcN/YlaJ family sporulation lipoprotein [Virgibacillus sp. AGTR]MDY7043314.1 YhcN/YlaJ family sporulation lipoprotein [Virgibacillus sp. M23]QRZ17853.1 YhcN/YlaJ family sporulation lipoprotein [Virgibacillus sp. AGTR]
MKTRTLIPIGLTSLLLITGCANNNNAIDERDQIRNELDPNQELRAPAEDGADDKLGYVRYTKEQMENNTEKNHSVSIDRTEMANMITRIMLRGDAFDEVATLVTDEEVLIAYQKSGRYDQDRTADMAKRTAMSVMPRYFKVYVSDNTSLINDIHSLHNLSTTEGDYDNTIQSIIKEMKKSPQGSNKGM